MKPDEIRAALDDASKETLADALSIFLTEGKAPVQSVAGKDKPELANFAQAVIYLKKNYDFEELDYFITEADLVYVNAGDRRILLTDRANVTSQEKRKNLPANDSQEEFENENTAASLNGGRFSNLEI
jgi:hypothetical protein